MHVDALADCVTKPPSGILYITVYPFHIQKYTLLRFDLIVVLSYTVIVVVKYFRLVTWNTWYLKTLKFEKKVSSSKEMENVL